MRFGNETGPLDEQDSLTVLVVDDEEFVRETLADMLDAMVHCVVAESGQQAIQRLGEEISISSSPIWRCGNGMAGKPA